MKSALITLLGMAAVQAVEVVEYVEYQTANCSSSVAATAPYVVANGCHIVYGNTSVNAMCSNGVPSLESFSSPNCEGTSVLETTCTPGVNTNTPAHGFICADLPDDDVVVFTMGDTCVGGDISEVTASYTLLVNQCLASLINYYEMHEITISSSNVMTYNVYSGTSCTGSPVESYIGPFGDCFMWTTTTAAGRLLSSTTAIKAAPAVAGVQIQTDSPVAGVQIPPDSPASKVNGDLISLLLVVIAAVFLGA
jgi:hypothetical protein